jgi:hypothetical protein
MVFWILCILPFILIAFRLLRFIQRKQQA